MATEGRHRSDLVHGLAFLCTLYLYSVFISNQYLESTSFYTTAPPSFYRVLLFALTWQFNRILFNANRRHELIFIEFNISRYNRRKLVSQISFDKRICYQLVQGISFVVSETIDAAMDPARKQNSIYRNGRA